MSMPAHASPAFILSVLIVVEGSRCTALPNVNSIEAKAYNSTSGRDFDTETKNAKEVRICSERATISENNKDVACSTPWLIPKHSSNGSTDCTCGSSLGGVVLCNSTTQHVIILKCFCITYNTDKNVLIIGRCFYGCFIEQTASETFFHLLLPYYRLPSNTSQLNQVCGPFHRHGQLCGKCMDGFAPPVYSYNSSCVNCTEYGSNWAKYLTISFLPLTALFVVVVVFRVSAASGLLNVFVFICQTMTTPPVGHVFASSSIGGQDTRIRLLAYIALSVHGIWNLDFFGYCIPHFAFTQK